MTSFTGATLFSPQDGSSLQGTLSHIISTPHHHFKRSREVSSGIWAKFHRKCSRSGLQD